jgi:hypothetical protein
MEYIRGMRRTKRFLIGLTVTVGFMIVFLVLEFSLTSSDVKESLQTAAGITFTLVGLYFMFRSNAGKDTRAVEAKISEIRNTGEPLAYEIEEVAFNEKDISVFLNRRNFLIVSIVAGSVIIPSMVVFCER